jgi:hypothetical protein
MPSAAQLFVFIDSAFAGRDPKNRRNLSAIHLRIVSGYAFSLEIRIRIWL